MNCSCSVTKRMHKKEEGKDASSADQLGDDELGRSSPLPSLASDLRCSDYGHNVSKLVSGIRAADGN